MTRRMNGRWTRMLAAGACTTAAVLLAACGGETESGTPVPESATAATQMDAAETDAPGSKQTHSQPSAGVSEKPEVSAPYRAEEILVSGSTDTVDYDVVIPQISGGDPAVVTEFNESMRAALEDWIQRSDDMSYTLSTQEHEVTRIGEHVVAGLLVASYNANPPGAHPTPLVATVVVNTDTAAPITLQDLFPDLQAGLNRLSEQAALLLPGTAAGPEYFADGIAPETANFANWLPTPAGMEIHFDDYQVGPHAVGLVTITVPWENLTDVMDPYMATVVAS
ncbi:RsiV family protein [Rhodococcus sp. NPDC003382]